MKMPNMAIAPRGSTTRVAALSTGQLALIAEHLKALSEPARLQILSTLIARPRTVNEIVALTGMHQANVSKHLQLLHAHSIVSRRRDRQFMHYALTDERVLALCELVCASLEDAADARKELIGV